MLLDVGPLLADSRNVIGSRGFLTLGSAEQLLPGQVITFRGKSTHRRQAGCAQKQSYPPRSWSDLHSTADVTGERGQRSSFPCI